MIHRFGPAQLSGYVEGHADERPPLVLLHGLTFDHQMWMPALDALRRIDPGRHVLALDLPGHGESSEPPPQSLHEIARVISLAIEDAGFVSPVLVGHSVAAVISTIYAARYPTRGVVNVDQSLTMDFARMLKARAAAVAGPEFVALWRELFASMRVELLPDSAQQLLRSTCRPRQDVVLAYWQQALVQPVEDLERMIAETLSCIRRAELPYTVVAGAEASPSYRKWLASILPLASVTVMPGSGHFPHLAYPDAFAGALATTAMPVHARRGMP